MFGKGAIIAAMGFVMAFSVYQLKLTSAVNSTTENFNEYFMELTLHQNTLSAINYGINHVWDQDTTSGNFTITADLCTSNVVIAPVSADTVMVKVNSWCFVFDDNHYQQYSKPLKMQDSVVAFFSYYTAMSRYFWYTNNEGDINWVTGDTVRGLVHSNGTIKTTGAPVFFDKVTAFLGFDPMPNLPASLAEFIGGWEVGIENQIPTDLSYLIAAATTGNGGAPMNTKSLYDEDAEFEFLFNGNVRRTISGVTVELPVATIAPTGVIYSTKEVRVKGILNGQLTIYTTDDIYVDDDMVYADDPIMNPNSNDVLGLVAHNDIFITDNIANNLDCHIQAALMSMTGGIQAENYATRPVSGKFKVAGSFVQDQRGPMGTFFLDGLGNVVIASGFIKDYRFDTRFATISPPFYPFIRQMQLAAWWE